MNNPIKIAALDSHLSVADKIKQIRAVGTVMAADADVDIVTQGKVLLKEADIITGKVTDQVNAHSLAVSTTKAVKAEEKTGGEVYSTSTGLLETKFPNDETSWKKYSVDLTLPGSAAVLPDAVKGGSVVQSPFAGRGIMHFNHLKKVDFYKVMESTGDPADLTTYYPANPSTFDSSAGGEVFPKVIGKPTFWIVIAHNHAGDGPPSAPFTNTIH
jgi:hypothetical protein